MWHRVKDLSSEQRFAIETLIGRRLHDDEGLNIQPSRILKEAPTGEERTRAYSQYLANLDVLADRVKGVPDAELEAIIDEACDYARHSPS
jgi:hypothetical protein